MKNLLIVGYGNMAKALHTAWQWDYSITKISPGEADCYNSPEELPPSYRPDIIVFAVKPNVLLEIIMDYRSISHNAICVSIAAGVTIQTLDSTVSRAWVRCMPNIAASVQSSVNGLYAVHSVTVSQKDTVSELFKKTGTSVWLSNEQEFHALTAVSGSGPAYIFLLCEVMTKVAIKLGLAPDISSKIVRRTILGAGHMLDHFDNLDVAELRKNVTSPNGTTQAALEVLMHEDILQNIMEEAITKASDRSLELSQPKKEENNESEEK